MFHKDFKEFIELLNKHEVEYLLVGGYARRLDLDYNDLLIHVIGLEDFKKNKAASGRPKDITDLQNLE